MADPFVGKVGRQLSELEEERRSLRSTTPGGRSSPRHGSRSPREARAEKPFVDSRPDIYPWPLPDASQAAEQRADEPIVLPTTLTLRPGLRSETELKQKIEALEDTVAEYEQQKFNVMGTFAQYRERVADRERKLEAEYSTKIISLSEEVLNAKRDFENRMKQFQALQEKFEREKEAALEKLRQEHQKEIQQLEQRCSESQLLNLEQKYMLEIQRLEEERKSMRAEKEHLGEAFQTKLRRAQSLYETELTAAKSLYMKELEALQMHEEALKEELIARQDDFKDRLGEMQIQFEQREDELAKCKRDVTQLEERLRLKEAEVTQIAKELQEARSETDTALDKLHTVEHELSDTKKRFRDLEGQLQRKSNTLSILEAAKNRLESLINDLQVEVQSLKKKVAFLENERQNLESQSESQAKLQNSQVQALEAVLETVTKEKQATKMHYESLMENERSQADDRALEMKRNFTKQILELEEQNNALRDQIEATVAEETSTLREKLEATHEKSVLELTTENEALENEVSSLRSKLHSALQTTGGPDSHKTRRELEVKEKALKDASGQVTELIVKNGAMRRELDEARRELDERRSTIDELRTAAQSAPSLPQRTMGTRHVATDTDLAAVSQNDEVIALRAEKAALQERLRARRTNEDTPASPDADAEREIQKLEKQLAEQEIDHDNKVASLYERIQKLDEQRESQEAQVRLMREEVERTLRSKFAEAAAENHVAEMETFEKQLQTFKERAETKELEQTKEIETLRSEVALKEEQIESLQLRTRQLMEEVDNISGELDRRTRELKQFGQRTDEYIRSRERQQSEAHGRKLAKLCHDKEETIAELRSKEEHLSEELNELRTKLSEATSEGSRQDSASVGSLDACETAAESDFVLVDAEGPQTVDELCEKGEERSGREQTHRCRHQHATGKQEHHSRKGAATAAGQQPLCKRAQAALGPAADKSAALVHRWHSLVDQVQQENATTRATPPPPPRSDAGSDADAASTAGAQPRGSTTLKLPEGRRRQSKSPVRSTSNPKVKIEERPAWRF